jgi:hypothetical protein
VSRYLLVPLYSAGDISHVKVHGNMICSGYPRSWAIPQLILALLGFVCSAGD